MLQKTPSERETNSPSNTKRFKEIIDRKKITNLLGIKREIKAKRESQTASLEQRDQQNKIFGKKFCENRQYGQSDELPKSKQGVFFSSTNQILKKMDNKRKSKSGIIDKNLNLEVYAKWIPKAQLVNMHLPTNFVLKNDNFQMSLSALKPMISPASTLNQHQTPIAHQPQENNSPNPPFQNEIQSSQINQSKITIKQQLMNKIRRPQSQILKQRSQSERTSLETQQYPPIPSGQLTPNIEIPAQINSIEYREQNITFDSPLNNIQNRKGVSSAKLFREHENNHKAKETVRENLKVGKKENKKLGNFVEFSKIGPGRSISCLQSRIDHLFNNKIQLLKNNNSICNNSTFFTKTTYQTNMSNRNFFYSRRNSPSQKNEQQEQQTAMEQYKVINAAKDSMNTKLVTDNQSIKRSQPPQSNSKKIAMKLLKDMKIQLERETIEEIHSKYYTLRTNLNSVVNNIREINLKQTTLSSNDQQIISPKADRFSSKENMSQNNKLNIFSLQSISKDQKTAYAEDDEIRQINSVDGMACQNSSRLFLNSQEGIQGTSSDFVPSPKYVSFMSDLKSQKQNTFGNNFIPDITSRQSVQIPKEDINFISLGSTPSLSIKNILEIGNDEVQVTNKENQEQMNKDQLSDRSLNFKQVNLQDKQKNNSEINISNQQSYSKVKKDGVDLSIEQKRRKIQNQKQKMTRIGSMIPKSRPISSYIQEMNLELNIKAFNIAIKEFKEQEFEDNKHLFDPNYEQIKRKKRVKQNLKILLLRCARLNLKTTSIHTVSLFSTTSYQNRGSFVFLESVKKNQIQTALQLLAINKYFIFDYDSVKQTALHYSCKKGFLEMTLLLIENGADINAQDSMGRTPLFYALIIENKQLIKAIHQTFNILNNFFIFLKELLCLKCSPWSGDNFTFLKKHLPQDIQEILKVAKKGDILCKMACNISDKTKIWNAQCDLIRQM